MKAKTFDVKAFWKEMKDLFPDIDLSSIKDGFSFFQPPKDDDDK